MTLFTDKFPIIKDQKELDALIAKYPSYDPYYIASGSIPRRKIVFDALYPKFSPYADSHFLTEVKTNFHQRTWEMYIACAFLDNGLTISSGNKGPDIKIESTKNTIWIECVASTHGEGEDKVPYVPHNGAFTIPEEQILFRLTSSLTAKFKVYQEYLQKNYVRDDDIFIIAINSGELGYPLDDNPPFILKCLFSIGYLTIPISPPGEPYYSRREVLTKGSGSFVPMDIFENEQYEGISAVIYSNTTVLNHPQKIGEDCLLVHNPLARNKLAEDTFPFLKQYKKIDNQIIKI